MLPRKGGVKESLYIYPGGELGFSNNWTYFILLLHHNHVYFF